MLSILLAAALASSAAGGGPLAVTNVVGERVAFDPEANERISWRFHMSSAARVTVSIYDARNVLVRTLDDKRAFPEGDQRIEWDGRDDSGRLAPPGYYLLTIDAESGGVNVRYDPTDSTGGKPFPAATASFDPASHLVRYALARSGIVQIRLGLKDDGPLLRTLVDWVARAAGEHSEPWDGWDASHVVEFGGSPKLDVQVSAYELPVNAVVVKTAKAGGRLGSGNGRHAVTGPARTEYLDYPKDRPVRPREVAPLRHEMYNHWQHARDGCGDIQASIEVVSRSRSDASETALVVGPLRLRADLPPGRSRTVAEERFEIVTYLDGTFLAEEEQGYLPFTWDLRPEIVAPGDHVVTVMIRGYEGHFGTASCKIRVQAPSELKTFTPGAQSGGSGHARLGS